MEIARKEFYRNDTRKIIRKIKIEPSKPIVGPSNAMT